MAITTLNQAVKVIKTIADAHLQVRSFFEGDPWDFATSGVTNYPAVICVTNDVEFSRNTIKYNFDLYFMDKERNGQSNRTEVTSDMILIAKDFQSEMRHPDWNWTVDFGDSNKVELFAEKFDDWVDGCKMNVNILLQMPDDTCQIPESITRVSP